MKRVLCLSIKARSRFVYVLSDCAPMVELLRLRLRMPVTEPLNNFLREWRRKVTEAATEVRTLDIFKSPWLWAGVACDDRHVYTRYIVHGFHHLVCSRREFHEDYSTQCICRFCSQQCAKYHAVDCPALQRRSLHFFSRWNGRTTNNYV